MANAAFEAKGIKLSAPRPHMGQAHQQYFTPRPVAEAFADIAEGIKTKRPSPLTVLDPTAGSGRLLVPFRERGHHVLGIELDARLIPVLKRAIGRESVRAGDIMQYVPYLDRRFDVVATNPPYNLFWLVPDGWVYREVGELKSSQGKVESQAAILGLAAKALVDGGLLLGVFSASFFQNHPKAREYLFARFGVLALAVLPKPFKKEYGIDVDVALVAALRLPFYVEEKAARPETWEGRVESAEDFRDVVLERWEAFRLTAQEEIERFRQTTPTWYYHTTGWNWVVRDVPKGQGRAIDEGEGTKGDLTLWGKVPHLDMMGDTPDTTLKVTLTRRGVRGSNPWSQAWLKFLNEVFPAFNAAEGTISGVVDAWGAPANILIAGLEETTRRWQRLGFEVDIPEREAEAIARERRRWERESLPLVVPNALARLAYLNEGWHTARRTVQLRDGQEIRAGVEYYVKPGWGRMEVKVGERTEEKKHVREYRDTAYTRFTLTPRDGGEEIEVSDLVPKDLAAMVEAFGLPEVATVEDRPEHPSWVAQLERQVEHRAQRNGGKRLYERQFQDVARFLHRSRIAVMHEQGAGKTPMAAFWAATRGYKRVLVVAQASLVPNWLAELRAWGFEARLLTHKEVARIKREIREGSAPEDTVFYVVSYEALSLGESAAIPDPWTCHETVRTRGQKTIFLHPTRGIRTRTCPGHLRREENEAPDAVHASEVEASAKKEVQKCTVHFSEARMSCPVCGADLEWNGVSCSACGHVARSHGTVLWGQDPTTLNACPICGAPRGKDGWHRSGVCHACGANEPVRGNRQYPLYKRVKKLFTAVILDEAQLAKNKGTQRERAVHALRARGKALLSGTLIGGYVTDLYQNLAWLLGHGTWRWPFARRGGIKRFLEQFAVYKFLIVVENHKEVRTRGKLLPDIANPMRLWRLLDPVSIRRRREEVVDLPDAHEEVVWVEMSEEHRGLYARVEGYVADEVQRTLYAGGASVNMGRISGLLWQARYAAAVPTEHGLRFYAPALGIGEVDEATGKRIIRKEHVLQAQQYGNALQPNKVAKVQKALELIQDIQAKGEKVIVFSSLLGLLRLMRDVLDKEGIPYRIITGSTPARERLGIVRAFEAGEEVVLLASTNALNRGFTITGANNAIILNLEWSPEATEQAKARIHRPGQTRECFIWTVLVQSTIEADMYDLVVKKREAQLVALDKEVNNWAEVERLLRQAESNNAILEAAKRLVQRKGTVVRETVAVARRNGKGKSARRRQRRAAPAQQLTLFDLSEYTIGALIPA